MLNGASPQSLHIAYVAGYPNKKCRYVNDTCILFKKINESTRKNILASMFLRPAQGPYT